MSAANRVIKNTGFLYAKMGITMFISLYTTRLILNALGASDFGVFNLVGGAIAMLGFLNAAMAGATQRFMSYSKGEGDKEKQKRIFNISFILHITIAIVLGFVLLIAGWFFFNGILNIAPERVYAAKVVYASLIVSTIFTIMTVPYDAVINAHENMLYYSIVGILESFLKLGAAFAVVNYVGGDKLVLYGMLMATIPLITMTIMRFYCHKNYAECIIAPKRYWDRSLFKEMTRFAGWSLLGISSGMIANYGQGIVINLFFGTAINASQGIANQVNGQLSVFASTLLRALNPLIVKSEGANDRNSMLKASFLGSKVSFFLLMFIFIPFLIEMPLIFKFWLKEVPEYTIIFCTLLLIRVLIEQLFHTLSTSIAAVGNVKLYQIFSSILNVFPLIVSYILFSMNYPAYIIYIVFIVYSLFSAGITLFFAKSNCNLSISLFLSNVINRCVITFIITLILSSTPILVISDGLFRLLLILMISTITSMLISWFIGFTEDERYDIWQIGKSIKKVLKLQI
jgi:O-antigen/teichoic acid export membrane protein